MNRLAELRQQLLARPATVGGAPSLLHPIPPPGAQLIFILDAASTKASGMLMVHAATRKRAADGKAPDAPAETVGDARGHGGRRSRLVCREAAGAHAGRRRARGRQGRSHPGGPADLGGPERGPRRVSGVCQLRRVGAGAGPRIRGRARLWRLPGCGRRRPVRIPAASAGDPRGVPRDGPPGPVRIGPRIPLFG